ncbi:MAG TPA: hypothetical protein VHX90_06080 [Verrucomicrobiae bacterium]|nr:hypothetical protein [Verrucomicrobiae bacterium]
MKIPIIVALLFAFVFIACAQAPIEDTNVDATIKSNWNLQEQLELKREPAGSKTLTFVDYTNNTVIYSNSVSHSNWVLKINFPPPPISLPYTYKDKDTGIIFYVEADGQHITAIDSDGKILWRRDPFADTHLEHYRTDNPRIVYIGEVDKADRIHHWIVKNMLAKGVSKFICITYDSSQSGCLDFKTGDFTFLGQN